MADALHRGLSASAVCCEISTEGCMMTTLNRELNDEYLGLSAEQSLMRVLVVEDERDLLNALVQSLRESNYAVDEASEGKTGLYKALTNEYDAIVLDLMLPGLNGFDVLKELRKKKKTPVLILTARDALNDRVRGLD